MIAKIW